MLSKKERLGRESFSHFFRVGKRTHTPSFQYIHAAHPSFHASVVVSKKIAKRAVDRNKIRRRIYDILRRAHTNGSINGVYIILTKNEVGARTYMEMKHEILTHLTQ